MRRALVLVLLAVGLVGVEQALDPFGVLAPVAVGLSDGAPPSSDSAPLTFTGGALIGSGGLTLTSFVGWSPVTERRCSRCNRLLHDEGEVWVQDGKPEPWDRTRWCVGGRLVFRGCTRCLIEVLDDYARLTSASLAPGGR